MKVRVFQIITAVGELDRKTGHFRLEHGAFWSSGFFATCNWRVVLPRFDMDEARELLAAHLNECAKFEWPLLPTVVDKTAITMPHLTARDVCPGSNLDTETLIHFGVTSDAFEIDDDAPTGWAPDQDEQFGQEYA